MEARKVLLVDDEPGVTKMLKLFLEQGGEFAVREVNDGREAVAVARRFRPDIVVLDIVMPGISGGQIAEQMKDDPALSHIPIIFLTAVVSRSEVSPENSMIAGHPFLAKPVLPDEVQARIRQLLGI